MHWAETENFKRTTLMQTHTSTRSQQTRLAAWQTGERNLLLLERQVCSHHTADVPSGNFGFQLYGIYENARLQAPS